MKLSLTFAICLLISFESIASTNTVDRFYGDLSLLYGYELKTKLKEIISEPHQNRGYGALINVYFQSDADRIYDNDGSIVDIYSERPNEEDSYTYSSRSQKCGNYNKESDCFNREHIFPQSVFKKKGFMKSDFFHIFPTDGHVNHTRDSHPFGEVSDPVWLSQNGSKLGLSVTPGYNGTVFEPIDEFKGDVARALLYFATRYEDKIAYWKHDMINGTSDQVYSTWFIRLLLKWHKMDPVNEHEKYRNEIGHKYQGNRNPFIDYPDFATRIWRHI